MARGSAFAGDADLTGLSALLADRENKKTACAPITVAASATDFDADTGVSFRSAEIDATTYSLTQPG